MGFGGGSEVKASRRYIGAMRHTVELDADVEARIPVSDGAQRVLTRREVMNVVLRNGLDAVGEKSAPSRAPFKVIPFPIAELRMGEHTASELIALMDEDEYIKRFGNGRKARSIERGPIRLAGGPLFASTNRS